VSKSTCTEVGCDKPRKGRKLCATHYQQWYCLNGAGATRYAVTCVGCGVKFGSTRRTGKFCSDICKGDVYRTKSRLPSDHPVMVLIAEARRPKAAPRPTPFCRECAWCGDTFTTTRRVQVNCSKRCKVRAIKNRRRGREHGSTSHYTWAEVMRLFIGKFNRCCAYCEQPIEGLPDPDHVVPLSRGGSNSITNVLPCCSPCNSDKRDLLLHEWAADRERLGKAPRVTSWDANDPRTAHLTDALLASAA
jgi:hypothetical protein